MTIDTSKVAGRRSVHYESVDDILKDAERLAQYNVRLLGNWSQGQIYKHVANAMLASLDGFTFKAPWYIRLVMRLFRGRFLNRPMPAGFRLPAKAEAQIVPGATNTQEGLELLRQAVHRLGSEQTRQPSPVFGTMSVEQWNKLHQRHAELHMSFIVEA